MKCAKLTSLDLSSNDIRDITELEHVKGMATVTSLRLQDNPVAKNSHDIGALCSSVRKYFPNLQFLVRGGLLGFLGKGVICLVCLVVWGGKGCFTWFRGKGVALLEWLVLCSHIRTCIVDVLSIC